MDAFFIEEKIHELLAAKFEEETFQDCFLVEFNLHRGNKLAIFIDCDSGVTLGKCQQVSRYLESFFDQEGWLGENYVLEVSSTGLDRPLKLLRQYRKNIGRQLKVTLKDGSSIEGLLKSVTEDAVTLEEISVRKEGKKKVKSAVQRELRFDNIKKTIVVISF